MDTKSDCQFVPQVGPRKGESHPSASVEGCPSYSGGGNNRSVGRQTAGLRKHNLGIRKLDSELALDSDDVEPEVEAPVTRTRAKTADQRMIMDPRVVITRLSESDTDSMLSVESETLPGDTRRVWRKRPGSRSAGGSESEDPEASATEENPSRKMTKLSKGRGRPPTTGQYVGLAQAKEAYAAAERQLMEAEAEREVAEIASQMRTRQLQRLTTQSSYPDDDNQLASALNQQVLDGVDVILNVANKSRNLKGTFQRNLKDAAAAIKEAAVALHERTLSEETRRLQEDNARLRQEVAELRKEMAELRTTVLQSQRRESPSHATPDMDAPSVSEAVSQPRRRASSPRPQMEDLVHTIMVQVGTMINARLDGLEDRLLPAQRIRPPLASDTRIDETSAAPQPVAAPTVVDTASKKKARRKRVTKAAAEAAATAATQARPSPAQPAVRESWATVAKRGGKSQPSQGPGKPKPSQGPGSTQKLKSTSTPKKVSLRSPNTSAVVLTLQPGAADRGITYADVLTEAKNKVDIRSLDITSLRLRQAATGARLLELSGPNNGEKADILAQKLRENLSDEVVKISRPTKCAELRIWGLDDSASAEEVLVAVARLGDCTVESLKAGEIRRDSQGLGIIWVRCPIKAAKKVAESKRLLVGWVSARVQVLEPRQMRCFRCFESGHAGTKCTGGTDRSRLCYRCGQEGHKANTCSSSPHCVLCAAKEKPANHRVGSKECVSPPPKPKGGKTTKKTRKPAPAKPRQAPRQTDNHQTNAEAMEVSPPPLAP